MSTDVHDATVCQFNFIRLILIYLKNFEIKNVNYALNYCFFLHKLQLNGIAGFKGYILKINFNDIFRR